MTQPYALLQWTRSASEAERPARATAYFLAFPLRLLFRELSSYIMLQEIGIKALEVTQQRSSQTFIDDGDTEPASKGGCWWEGWKETLYLGSVTSLIVLILNLAMVGWTTARHSDQGPNVLYTGSCDRSKQMSTGIHLLINIMSTFLLSASNFGMVGAPPVMKKLTV